MAVAFRSAGTLAGGTGDVTPGLPAGYAADDIFLLCVESETGDAVSAPSGYAAVTDSPQTSTAGSTTETRLSVFWKRASGSESAPTVTDAGDHTTAVILAFSGVIATGDPWDVTGGTAGVSSTSVSWPSVTTTVGEAFVVSILSHGIDTAVAACAGYTNANLSSLTELHDAGAASGSGGGIVVCAGTMTVAGAVGATTATMTLATKKALIVVALKPASGSTSIGAASGTSTATATPTGAVFAVGSAAGTCTVLGIAIGNVGTAAGTCTVSGVGRSIALSPGLAEGTSDAVGIGDFDRITAWTATTPNPETWTPATPVDETWTPVDPISEVWS